MGPFEKFFFHHNPESQATLQDVENPGRENIQSSHDFMQAIYEGRLAEAEAYLQQEKNQPSQSGHDEHWLHNKLSILLSKYIETKDASAVERINQLLPANYQRQIKE